MSEISEGAPIKYWKIREGLNEADSIKAIQALIAMMQVGIGEERFKMYAEKQPDLYKYFEKE